MTIFQRDNSSRFLERDGFSMGPPEDDVAAIEGVERLRRRGVCLVVIAWPAFWWLDRFRELHRYLRRPAEPGELVAVARVHKGVFCPPFRRCLS
jgi:hypothetical protein